MGSCGDGLLRGDLRFDILFQCPRNKNVCEMKPFASAALSVMLVEEGHLTPRRQCLHSL